MREYVLFGGKDQIDMINALLKHEFNPTENTKAEVDRISGIISEKVKRNQIEAEKVFVELYGEEILSFVKSISRENFLSAKSHPYCLSWEVKTDYDNDNYWVVNFSKGKFSYCLEAASGYGGIKILEDSISQERVLELIKQKK